jgi:hypothetical protein
MSRENCPSVLCFFDQSILNAPWHAKSFKEFSHVAVCFVLFDYFVDAVVDVHLKQNNPCVKLAMRNTASKHVEKSLILPCGQQSVLH